MKSGNLLKDIVTFGRCFYYSMLRNELFFRSAALTYYAMFSIFPILILLSTLTGWILQDSGKEQAVINAVIGLMPAGAEIITGFMQDVLSGSTVTSIIALITLLWSATGFFRGLLSAIDLIHSREFTHNTFVMRGIGVILIILAIPAVFLLLFLSSLASIIIQFIPATVSGYVVSLLNILANGFAVFVVAAIAFFLLFRYVPSRRPPIRSTIISAILTSLGWLILGYGFSWYLSSGFGDFNVVYGSIGAVMALMLYLYLSNVVILFGAEVNATFAHFKTCRTPHIAGLDDALRLLRLPMPEIHETESPPNKPTNAP